MPFPFRSSQRASLGVEMEFQLVDATSLDLTPVSPAVLARYGASNGRVKPEIFQSMIEVCSDVCASVDDAERDLRPNLVRLHGVCAELGVVLATAGSHPFARYVDRLVYPDARYRQLLDRNRWIAQRLSIFGVHVHVGRRDGDHAVSTIHGLGDALPWLLALSASSPFWQGNDTGLASSRSTIFEAMPTAGRPLRYDDWASFERLFDALVRSGSIASIKDLWWDVRPHPDFGTIEIRLLDSPATLTETLELVAVVQCLVARIDRRIASGDPLPQPVEWVKRENKWRAMRHGLACSFVVDEAGGTIDARTLIRRELDDLAEFAEELGCAPRLASLRGRLDGEPAYERQRRIASASGLPAVVRDLADRLAADLGVS